MLITSDKPLKVMKTHRSTQNFNPTCNGDQANVMKAAFSLEYLNTMFNPYLCLLTQLC